MPATRTLKPGARVIVSTTIGNGGGLTAPSVTSGLYISTDRTVTSADLLLDGVDDVFVRGPFTE